jgi:uncharacterized membrane protein
VSRLRRKFPGFSREEALAADSGAWKLVMAGTCTKTMTPKGYGSLTPKA